MPEREAFPAYRLTYQDVLDILRLIDSASFGELHVEIGDLKLRVTRGEGAAAPAPSASAPVSVEGTVPSAGAPVSAGSTTPAAAPVAAVSGAASADGLGPSGPAPAAADAAPGPLPEVNGVPADGVAVKSPMTGVFYAAPAPGADPFVKVGATVREGDTVGIIEVMKLFTSIPAPCDGTVKAILVKNEQAVERDQVLMIIEAEE